MRAETDNDNILAKEQRKKLVVAKYIHLELSKLLFNPQSTIGNAEQAMAKLTNVYAYSDTGDCERETCPDPGDDNFRMGQASKRLDEDGPRPMILKIPAAYSSGLTPRSAHSPTSKISSLNAKNKQRLALGVSAGGNACKRKRWMHPRSTQ